MNVCVRMGYKVKVAYIRIHSPVIIPPENTPKCTLSVTLGLNRGELNNFADNYIKVILKIL